MTRRLTDVIDRVRSVRTDDATLRVDPRGKRVLLVYLFSGLGDAALLAPVVMALLDRGAEVGLLVRPLAREVLRFVDRPIRIHVFGARGLAREIRAAKYDLAVDLTMRDDVDARSWLLAPLKLGFVAPGESRADAGLDAGSVDARHHTDRHWSRALVPPLHPLGIVEPIYEVPFFVTRARVLEARSRWGSSRKPRLLVVPGSRSEEKRWDRTHYAAIARDLSERHRARVILSGAPWERSALARMAKEIPNASLYTGRDLGLLLALLAECDLVLGNDTGPIHLAYLLHVPTIALYTTMSPLSWGPPEPDPRFHLRRVEGARGVQLDEIAAEITSIADRALTARVPRAGRVHSRSQRRR
jgi:ADP-heptose:LPS heptosyltransferase